MEGCQDGWERALYAFLAEKHKRTGSLRTVGEYQAVLSRFFGSLGVTPYRVRPDQVHAFCYGKGPSGREPSAATVALRLAALSSFYRFLKRMGLAESNPCEAVQRPRSEPSPPRGLTPEEVRRLLGAMPNTPAGIRDRAIILTAILTGRRRAEVLNLRAGDLSRNGAVFYSYRNKGGRVIRRELPRPAFRAIVEALEAEGRSLENLAPRCTPVQRQRGGLLRQPAPPSPQG